MFLALLVYLGWGRCGLLGEGSSVVELGEELVSWDYPRDLYVRGERGMFGFLGRVDGLSSWGEVGSKGVEVGDGSFL